MTEEAICKWFEGDDWQYESGWEKVQPLTRCKECRFFERDHFDSVYIPTETGEAERMPLITAHEICTKWGDGCKTAEDGYCFLAERREQ